MADSRHRVPYAVIDVVETQTCPPSNDLQLFVVLEGPVEMFLDGVVRLVLKPREVVATLPGTTVRVGGPGRVGVLTILNELEHAARRVASAALLEGRPSPEYQPPQES